MKGKMITYVCNYCEDVGTICILHSTLDVNETIEEQPHQCPYKVEGFKESWWEMECQHVRKDKKMVRRG